MKNAILSIILLCNITVQAQKKVIPPAPEPPVGFTSLLAGRGTGNWPKELVARLVDSPLTVKDNKGRLYPVTSFTLLYWFKSTYVDGQTKQRKQRGDLRMQQFNGDRLSEVWRASIKDNVKSGDSIVIDKVIVRQPNGKLRLVNGMNISVK